MIRRLSFNETAAGNRNSIVQTPTTIAILPNIGPETLFRLCTLSRHVSIVAQHIGDFEREKPASHQFVDKACLKL